MNATPRIRRAVLSLAVAAALGLSQPAAAQSEREAQLEARVAELERLVAQLVGQQQAIATQQEATAAEVAARGGRQAATPGTGRVRMELRGDQPAADLSTTPSFLP